MPREDLGQLTWPRLVGTTSGLVGLLLASLLGATAIGPAGVELAKVLVSGPAPSPDFVIVFEVRLPRVLLAALVGGSLAGAGCALQALLRNPLADPHILGISAGGSLAAVVAMVWGGALLGAAVTVPMAAFVGAAVSTAAIFRLGQVRGKIEPYTLLLVGVVYNAFAGAMVMFINSVVDLYQAHGILFWLMGSLSSKGYAVVLALFAYSAAGMLLLLARVHDLNLLALGEDAASTLGVSVERSRRTIFLASALLVGAVVSVSGLIGFVGLIVPHVTRLLFGSDQRLLLPASYLVGATFLVWADTLARSLMGGIEIPVGVVTAFAGAPFFVYLLRREKQKLLGAA